MLEVLGEAAVRGRVKCPALTAGHLLSALFEHFVPSRQNASSDIARPEQTRALVAPREELSWPKDGFAEARPLYPFQRECRKETGDRMIAGLFV